MSLYALDTDILTLYQSGHPAVRQHVGRCRPGELAITVMSVEEQLSGWYRQLRRAKKPDQLARIYQRLATTVESLAGLPILSFTEPSISRYDGLRAVKLNLRKMGCGSPRSRWSTVPSWSPATAATSNGFRG